MVRGSDSYRPVWRIFPLLDFHFFNFNLLSLSPHIIFTKFLFFFWFITSHLFFAALVFLVIALVAMTLLIAIVVLLRKKLCLHTRRSSGDEEVDMEVFRQEYTTISAYPKYDYPNPHTQICTLFIFCSFSLLILAVTLLLIVPYFPILILHLKALIILCSWVNQKELYVLTRQLKKKKRVGENFTYFF